MAARRPRRTQHVEFSLEAFSAESAGAVGVLSFDRTTDLQQSTADSRITASSTPAPSSPLAARTRRNIFDELDADLRSQTAPGSLTIDEYCIDKFNPPTFAEAEPFFSTVSGQTVNLATLLLEKFNSGQLRHNALGLWGPSSCGKSLFCQLFASANNFELIVVHETEPAELKDWLDLAVNDRIDGDTRPRFWLIEHWDDYLDFYPKTARLLHIAIKRMLRTGIVIFTSSTNVFQCDSSMVVLEMEPLTKDAATSALIKTAVRNDIKLGKHDALDTLEFSGSDLRSAVCSLFFFGGAPPSLLGQGKAAVPGNLRSLSNASLYSPSQLLCDALGEAQAATSSSRCAPAPLTAPNTPLDMLRAELPRAMCHKAGCLNVADGAAIHDLDSCIGDIDRLAHYLESCSAADAAGCPADFVSGTIQRAIHADDGDFKGGILPATHDKPLGDLSPRSVSKQDKALFTPYVMKKPVARVITLLDSFAGVPDDFGALETVIDKLRLRPWIADEQSPSTSQAEIDELVSEWEAAHLQGTT